ncbi:MAG: 2-succinyl-5-enolpyruvyl-6-hydroxy-3-cyclohexene-1-carboxylic-acid synthase [Actinobacteria bacterium HGW-Actinobacteria-4]|nr:MAG: 2-succinyl-5-enolpyruvyl-6-hydroxy-3-cyclohexene-1-carboxylic-acid synthase [Actinobacteria bacterium HGW-Actinobacteria-4]
MGCDGVTPNPSASFAREMIATLAAHGVRDFVLCPGSRSGPLAHALAEAASADPPLGAPQVNLHVRIDERSAAFLALGIARAHAVAGTMRPVAVVTTSGTAVGNLFPAAMEAHHSGLPLLLLTADRPGELRGVGANQTTDQVGIFGTFARWSADAAAPTAGEAPGRAERLAARAVAIALGEPRHSDNVAKAGPVHLDLEFRAPLAADGGLWPRVSAQECVAGSALPADLPAGSFDALPSVTRGIVIAGDNAGDAARLVAEAHGWPLIAEPTSGARAGNNAIVGYLHVLASDKGRELADQVHQVVVVGRPTLSRPVQALIDQAASLFVASHGARWREAPRHAERIVPEVPEAWLTRAAGTPGEEQAEWLARWHAASPRRAQRSETWSADAVAQAFIASLKPRSIALLGSSGPIRAIDRLAPTWNVGAVPTIVANRGLAGIDGTVSTAVGMALGSGQPVVALMGDVTFLHDGGGLLIGPHEARPALRIVVVNDGGGTIFSEMEHAKAPADQMERVFTTPHAVDIASLCAAYGVRHAVVTDGAGLKAALAEPPTQFEVVEAKLTS